MTSAARPTWSAALASGGGLRDGSSSAPTLQTCAKDQPGHLKLKLRQVGQDAPEELRSKNFRTEPTETDQGSSKRITAGLISGDSDVEIEDSDSGEENENDFDYPDSKIDGSVSQDELEHDNSEEEDDEEAELMKELEKIRREREAEKAAKERKAAESDLHSVLAGNPLLASTFDTEASSFGAKRRWDDDVVFKNQAKGIDEKPQKRFINDTTRSDFHRRFMDKFIK